MFGLGFLWFSLVGLVCMCFGVFLINFRHLLRLAALSCFIAQLVKGRKTINSTIAFDLFLLLCSSFKLPSHDLVSKIYLFVLGLGLVVTKINNERLFDIWIRPLYEFIKSTSWPLFNFLIFFSFILCVETELFQ